MTLPLLIAISVMWLPLGAFLLGKGEAKSTGAICLMVGVLVIVGTVVQASVFKDPFVAGLLFVHGLLYCATGYALVMGLENLSSVANVGLTVAIVSFIYMIVFLTGGPLLESGQRLVERSSYFAFACAGYTILTLEVWRFGYGKLSAPVLAWSLIVWVPFGLLIPAFALLVAGRLPF